MNIFVLDTDPTKCVVQYCDAHVVKMLLETTQILCGVHHRHGKAFAGIYEPSHLNHPCTVWAGATFGNYVWTVELLLALHAEFEYRYEKEHASKRLLDHLKRRPPVGLVRALEPREPFIFVGPDECASTFSGELWPEESYKNLYRRKAMEFKRPMRWTKRPAPAWMAAVLHARAMRDLADAEAHALDTPGEAVQKTPEDTLAEAVFEEFKADERTALSALTGEV